MLKKGKIKTKESMPTGDINVLTFIKNCFFNVQ